MAIQIQGTTVIDDSRKFQNVQVDTTISSKVVNLMPSSGSVIIDLSQSHYFTLFIDSPTTISFSGYQNSTLLCSCFAIQIYLSGNGSITWPSSPSIKWPNNLAPALTTIKRHIIFGMTGGQYSSGIALSALTDFPA